MATSDAPTFDHRLHSLRPVQSVLKWLFGAGLIFSAVVMAFLFGAGFALFYRAIALIVGGTAEAGSDLHASALVQVLKGLEYFFLAPLAYLVFLTMIRFVRTVVTLGDYRFAEEQMHGVKSLITSLMIAVVGTDLLSKILGPRGLTWDAATGKCSSWHYLSATTSCFPAIADVAT